MDERDVCEGQVAEEEVHGGVEVRVQPDEQDDEQVPQHCGQVYGQEQCRVHVLVLWLDGESQEDELGCDALIIPSDAAHFLFLELKMG